MLTATTTAKAIINQIAPLLLPVLECKPMCISEGCKGYFFTMLKILKLKLAPVETGAVYQNLPLMRKYLLLI
jgi:hypothetical protein